MTPSSSIRDEGLAFQALDRHAVSFENSFCVSHRSKGHDGISLAMDEENRRFRANFGREALRIKHRARKRHDRCHLHWAPEPHM